MNPVVEKFVRFCESDFGKTVLKREAEYLYNELKDSAEILDVGCGIGSFEQLHSELNITGLDSSEEMLAEARKRSPKTFVLGNAEKLDFDDAVFDAVFYVTTLEFIEDHEKAVSEAWRVTKPNGKIVVMALNPKSEYFNKHVQRPDSYFRKVKHRDLNELKDNISKFYDIKKEEYFLGIKGKRAFDTRDEKSAALFVIVGTKKPVS